MPENDAKLKEFANGLLAHEAASGKPAAGDGAAVFCICEKLRVSLSSLMGVAGYRLLLSRSLARAGADVPWLRGLHVQANGTLEGLAEVKTKLNDQQIALGEVALVAELIGLLVTFIGPALTLQLMRDVWPGADFSHFEF